MEAKGDAELQYVLDSLSLPEDFMDVGFPAASFPNLPNSPQFDFNSLLFTAFDSSGMSGKWQINRTCPSTDNLSDASMPSLNTENNSGLSSYGVASSPQQGGRHCRNMKGCCINLATAALRSMHVPSSSCILSMDGRHGSEVGEPQLSRAADTILTSNRAALQAIRAILQCPCFDNPQTLLLVTVLCSEVTATYWHIIDIYKNSAGSAADNVDSRKRDLFIGSHCLGKEVETAVIRQVLLGMIQELKVVIGSIACHTGPPLAGSEQKIGPVLSGVRARMVACLHAQLRALTTALSD